LIHFYKRFPHLLLFLFGMNMDEEDSSNLLLYEKY